MMEILLFKTVSISLAREICKSRKIFLFLHFRCHIPLAKANYMFAPNKAIMMLSMLHFLCHWNLEALYVGYQKWNFKKVLLVLV